MSLNLNERRNTVVDTIIRKECYTCDSLMPPYVYHCRACGHCVVYMDHHCPWVNNCVGLGNHGVFMCFLVSMLTLLLVTFISIVTNVNCWKNFDLPRESDKFLYTDLFLPDWAYS